MQAEKITREDMANGARFLARKYGLTDAEVIDLVRHTNCRAIINGVECWREGIGLPAADSGLVRGELLRRVKSP